MDKTPECKALDSEKPAGETEPQTPPTTTLCNPFDPEDEDVKAVEDFIRRVQNFHETSMTAFLESSIP